MIVPGPSRVVVGISGASGVIYGIRILQVLRELNCESHVVVSRAGRRTIAEETDCSFAKVRELSTVLYRIDDIGAAIAGGSFQTRAMIIAPCSIRTAAEISSGVTTTLLTRAADVTLKERRPLVLMVRETPFHTGHLRMLTNLSEIGAIIAPPVPAFYARPASFAEMIDHTVGRMLDLIGVPNNFAFRWQGSSPAAAVGSTQD